MAWPSALARGGNLIIALVSGGDRKVATLLGDNRLRPLDRPKGKIAPVGDRHRLGGLIHGVHIRSVQHNSLFVSLLMKSSHIAGRVSGEPTSASID